MSVPASSSWRQVLLGIVALLIVVALVVALFALLSRVLTGTVGGAIAGGLVALGVAVVNKALDRQKQRESAVAQKRREVYRGMMSPWEHVLAKVNAGSKGEDVMEGLDLAEVYANAFDAVLYGSEPVVRKYVEFRTPQPSRDGLDTMRAMAALLIAMREDVTGQKSALSEEDVLGTFVNLEDAERVALRLRKHLADNPDAQAVVQSALRGGGTTAGRPKPRR